LNPLVPIEDRISLPNGATGDDLLALLSEALKRPNIEEFSYRRGVLTVRRHGVEGEPLIDDHILDLAGILDSVEMEEVDSQDPHMTLFQMFFRVSTRGLEVSHVYVSDFRTLRKWLGLPEMVSLGGKLFGVRATKAPSLPDDVMLVCGSPRRSLDVGAIDLVVKTVMVTEGDDEEAD
jgi:hypothetical protein